MGIPNPTTHAETALETSLDSSALLISALKLGIDVDVERHQKCRCDTCYQVVAAREGKEKVNCSRLYLDANKVEENWIL